jgi:hypothetical protein
MAVIRFLRRVFWVLVGEGPVILFSGGSALAGWAIAVRSQPSFSEPSPPFWTAWSITFAAVAGLGFVLWIVREVRKAKRNPNEIDLVAIADRLDQTDAKLDSLLVVRRRGSASAELADSLTAPAGATIGMAIGVGPVMVIPNGDHAPYIVQPVPGAQVITLPYGGRVQPLHFAFGEAKLDG